MKRLFFVLLLWPLGSYCQDRISEKELELNARNLRSDSLLPSTDVDFGGVLTSSAWPDESAVILCQKTTFDFDKKGMSVGKRIGRNLWGLALAPLTLGTSMILANANTEAHMLVQETERRRILLRDKYGLENYSMLYFRQATDGDAFEARVIKKDGSITPVDLEDAVRIEDVRSVPGTFRSYTEPPISTVYRPTYFKIAIPDLVEGDIIEYEYRHFNPKNYYYNPQYKEFDPVYYLCNRTMPVVKQIIEVTTLDDHYFMTFKSLKGAPSFSVSGVGEKKVYRWVDADRDKLRDTRYVDDFREYPSVKFQVVYARSSSHDLIWFKSAADMQQDIPVADLAAKAQAFWFQSGKIQNTGDYAAGLSVGIGATVDALFKQMKKRGVADEPDEEYAQKAYYTIRAVTLYNEWSDYAFAKVFSGLLAKRRLDHDIYVTTYNTNCDLEKVAFSQELAWVIKFKGKFYTNPGEHGNPEDFHTYLIGNTAIHFNFRGDKASPGTDVIPLTDTSDNMLYTRVNASLEGSLISVVKTVQAKGLVKEGMEDDALALTPFMETDFRNYDGSSMWEGMDPRSVDRAMSDFSAEKKDWKEDKPKMMKAEAEDEYNASVEKYSDFKLDEDGRSYKKKSLKYDESFVLGGLTATAGPDLLVSLPALIGKQMHVASSERVRVLPVDLRYPRALLYSITFPVPAGYTAAGLSSLVCQVDNAVGSFTSSAAVSDGVLTISVRKLYKVRNLSATQWGDLCAVLDAAYAFSQKRVVFQKNP